MTRAASAARITCGQVISPAPNPPPRYGTSTLTSSSGRPNTVASTCRVIIGHWVQSWTTSRPPSQRAAVANSPIGLFISAGVVNVSS